MLLLEVYFRFLDKETHDFGKKGLDCAFSQKYKVSNKRIKLVLITSF